MKDWESEPWFPLSSLLTSCLTSLGGPNIEMRPTFVLPSPGSYMSDLPMGPPVSMELPIFAPVGLADLVPSGPSIHALMEPVIHVLLTLCANDVI